MIDQYGHDREKVLMKANQKRMNPLRAMVQYFAIAVSFELLWPK